MRTAFQVGIVFLIMWVLLGVANTFMGHDPQWTDNALTAELIAFGWTIGLADDLRYGRKRS